MQKRRFYDQKVFLSRAGGFFFNLNEWLRDYWYSFKRRSWLWYLQGNKEVKANSCVTDKRFV